MRTLALSMTLAASAPEMPGSVAEFRSDAPGRISVVGRINHQAPTLTPQSGITIGSGGCCDPLVVWAGGVGGPPSRSMAARRGAPASAGGRVPPVPRRRGVSEKVACLMSAGVGTDSHI
jgi:hypothetical protein